MTAPLVAMNRRRHDDEAEALRDPGRSRYRDARFGGIMVKVLPGDHYVTDHPEEVLVTVLGSCVAACIRDPAIGVGGMNHFMLPNSPDGSWGEAQANLRYGNFAMEHLINEILKRGGRRSRLEVKLFGGARVLNIAAMIGQRNVEFVEAYLKAEGIPVAARHLLGELPRRVHYFPLTGKVRLQELRRAEDLDLVDAEIRYLKELEEKPVEGSIEVFE